MLSGILLLNGLGRQKEGATVKASACPDQHSISLHAECHTSPEGPGAPLKRIFPLSKAPGS